VPMPTEPVPPVEPTPPVTQPEVPTPSISETLTLSPSEPPLPTPTTETSVIPPAEPAVPEPTPLPSTPEPSPVVDTPAESVPTETPPVASARELPEDVKDSILDKTLGRVVEVLTEADMEEFQKIDKADPSGNAGKYFLMTRAPHFEAILQEELQFAQKQLQASQSA
jgi:hypothetical protein